MHHSIYACALLGSCLPVMAATDYALSAQWHNRYVSEGRDNLADGGIQVVDASASRNGFSAGLWLADAISDDYQELNLTLAYRQGLGPVTAHAAYTRLEYLHDHSADNEIAVGIHTDRLPLVDVAVDYVYASDADGSFVSFRISRDFAIAGGHWQWTPYLQQNLDYGYVSARYNGPNNIEAGLDLAWQFHARLAVTASAAYSLAQQDVKNEDLGNIGWFGLGLAGHF